LLLVLSEALRARKLGDVARTLGLTPSAISHALARLRDIFGDPLFVRRPHGVEPTARALALAEPIARAIEELTRALEPAEFVPADLKRTFRIAGLDYLVTIHAPGLIGSVLRDAPDVKLSFVNLGEKRSLDGLADNQLDLAMGVFAPDPARFKRTVLGRFQFVTVARKRHPALRRGLTLETFMALDHVMVSGTGELSGAIDKLLAKSGRKRRVVASLPQFLASLAAVASSDVIASVPTGIAEQYAGQFALDVLPFPMPMPPVEYVAMQSTRSTYDQAVAWLLGKLPRTV
jgi:DNA-binding transcriptional LysR family regulator